MFYELCHGERDVPTLLSLRANIGVASASPKSESGEDDNDGAGNGPAWAEQKQRQSVRYVDWPGHAALSDAALESVFDVAARSGSLRIAVVLDSSQPVAPVADVLDQLFTILCRKSDGGGGGSSSSARGKKSTSGAKAAPIFVACNKQDAPKAKNAKRVKIQVRAELERLLRARAAAGGHGASDAGTPPSCPWWPNAGEPLDLDELPPSCRLHFGPLSCADNRDGEAWRNFVDYCRTGALPAAA